MGRPNTCDGCLGAKKKCDNISPNCTRCARLNIQCTGRDHMRFIFKDHFASAAQRERQQNRSGVGPRRQAIASPPPCPEIVPTPPLPTRCSSASSDISRPDTPRVCEQGLARRFSAALKIEDPGFNLSSLADWLPQVPERLAANDLLDNAALAFLDALDFIRDDADDVFLLSKTFENSMSCFKLALHGQDQANSTHCLVAAFMLSIVHKWITKSGQRYMSHMSSICALLNNIGDEHSGDRFTQAVRLSLTRIVCIESIINPSLVIDCRCLQSMMYEPAAYLPLDEENGQTIESLDLPFLVRLAHLLHAPEAYSSEISKNYERLKAEWPFTRRRYQSLAGIRKITSINRSALLQTEIQLKVAHIITLGISLVLNACLLAMDPMNTDLQLDALNNGREAVKVSRQLLEQLPKGVCFTPVALIASWVATDDPDITCDVFSTVREHSCYWSDPSYMNEAKMLKKLLLQLRAKVNMEQNSSLLSNFGVCLSYGGQGPHQQGNQSQESFSLQNLDTTNSQLRIDSHMAAFSGQLSPISEVRGWISN